MLGQEALEKILEQLVAGLKKINSDSFILTQNINDLVRCPYDAVTYDYKDETETRKYRIGGRKGKIVATVLIRYADNTRALIESRELKE